MSRPRISSARTGAIAASLITVAAVVSGCINSPPPPCPPVRVDSTTSVLTKFRDESSRELSNVAYQVEIVGFQGECVMDDEEVEVILKVDFEITKGPAAQAGPADFHYFVAIPQYFPQAAGKKIFEVQRKLSAGSAASPVSHTESNVRVEIPLTEDQPAAAFDVYLGLQLSKDQLEFNRSRMRQ